MQRLLGRIFNDIFDFEHILTPFAVEHIKRQLSVERFQTFKVFYVFGVRVAFYATTKFDI